MVKRLHIYIYKSGYFKIMCFVFCRERLVLCVYIPHINILDITIVAYV